MTLERMVTKLVQTTLSVTKGKQVTSFHVVSGYFTVKAKKMSTLQKNNIKYAHSISYSLPFLDLIPYWE